MYKLLLHPKKIEDDALSEVVQIAVVAIQLPDGHIGLFDNAFKICPRAKEVFISIIEDAMRHVDET